MDWAVPLLMLTGMEIILGIDNIIFLSILVGSLPKERQKVARIVGLALALGARMALLLGIKYVMGLERPLFSIGANAFSSRDLVLIGGGLFLIAKSVLEIHKKLDDEGKGKPAPSDAPKRRVAGSLASAIAQIIVLDLVFSLDSIISAIGMVKEVWIMLVAMSVAVVFMGLFSAKVSRFIETHATFKMLALSFLVLIGVVLIAEGAGTHIARGYIYMAMAFSLGVEVLNMRLRSLRAQRAARSKSRVEEREAHLVVRALPPAELLRGTAAAVRERL